MSDRFTLKVPDGVSYEALVCVLQSSTANGPAASIAAERAANRNGFDVTSAECRAAVEFLRIAIANEIARLAGAPAAVFSGGSSVLIERGE